MVSPYYYSLWGEHLHHGYWVTGKETKEDAQLALTKHLAEIASIKPGSRVLDVGCGFGASSIYLAKQYGAKTTGITISPVQVSMANKAAKKAEAECEFLLMDADNLQLNESFDVIWSIESISHYKNPKDFLEKATTILKPGGTLAVIDWFKKGNLSDKDLKKYITPIEKGMMVELHTTDDYITTLKSKGLTILSSEGLNKNTAKTWDISLEIISNKKFWMLAFMNGREFVNFLRSFKAMKNGFSSGNFVYGLIVARKP
jgi:tocopherol O-methyltransferase